MSFTTVLFDLDGTLTDPFEGITRSIQYALEKMGVSAVAAEDLRWCIGPPLWESFRVLLATEEKKELDRAVGFYRERYTKTGLYENTLIDGIPELLADLLESGLRLHVCTSKPHAYAGTIIEHFGLRPYFGTVYGSELDGARSAKAELIAHILRQEALQAGETVMIGDRKHDLIGANVNEVAGIGVLWGYGSREELEAEQPVLIAETPMEIAEFLQTACQSLVARP
ncbi:HAD hydrolase-like protein [Roseibium sediminicola]|uniref:HAD hydrolase-like protein n=1 Tax=Roseibium sediminicola TaxID=2933272 RepID=A0ABT0GRX5_9HYPH|nr:HAD hydrolase-like protein [Roseibium sp. CAU 1639]MCK7612196.1 HAD hydrolase-like protein [Roseibium sp. CAU 1639]